MRVACLGGGPAGLYFAISIKLKMPDAEVVVFERNRADDTFGWGVVLSDQTLQNLKANDPASAKTIADHFAYWDDVSVLFKGERITSTGHGFCGIGRMRLLIILQERAKELGVEINFSTEIHDVAALQNEFDLVVASDGLNSKTRSAHAEAFKPTIDTRACNFVWLGAHQKFDDAFTFIFEETEKGWIWAHAYQFDDDTATFIVECDEHTWEAYNFGTMSQQESIETCEEIFKDHLDGYKLMTNANHIRGSAWINFPRVLCERWHHENIVLLGDTAATAHFSIGSGTKLALESAIALAELLESEKDVATALDIYEEHRRTAVLRIQSAALNSLGWFEKIERYFGFDPVQFYYSQLTRSQRISHENLRLRDPQWLESAEKWFQEQAGVPADAPIRAPMFAPYNMRDLTLDNRVVVAPMMQYRAVDGVINDWHHVHYCERAKGGAGLMCTEMLSVSDVGRATPGCAGLYDDGHVDGWKRIVDFAHAEGKTKVCAQLGHAGPRASTKLPWYGENQALTENGWPVLGASDVAWGPDSPTPRPMTREEMHAVIDQFVAAAQRAEAAGFDMIEIHAGHGGLLASFLTPVTNLRADGFGGTAENRLKFPMEVYQAVRNVWPKHKPISIRTSVYDWLSSNVSDPGEDSGLLEEDAVYYSQQYEKAGIDLQVVSTGETVAASKPVYGRMYQTLFSDRLRNGLGVKTMTGGNVFEADHVNMIILGGRADLVAVGRPHLTDPYWTNREAAKLGDRFQKWPEPYKYGVDQLYALAGRSNQ